MDITQLRYFVVTAKHLNYTKASEELFISRQALRQSIQGMEQDLGSNLFQNRNNHLSLTQAGLLLQEKAPSVLDAFDRLETELRCMSQPFCEISLTYSGSIRTFLFTGIDQVLDEFREQNPAVPVRVTMASNDEIWELLRKGTCRFGLMMVMPWHNSEFSFFPLQTFTLGITLPGSHPLGHKNCLALSDLADRHCIGMGELNTTFSSLARDLQKYTISINYESVPDPIDAFYRAKHDDSLVFNVVEAQKDRYQDLRIVPIANYPWSLCLVYRNDRPLAKEEAFFMKYLKNHLDKHPIQFS